MFQKKNIMKHLEFTDDDGSCTEDGDDEQTVPIRYAERVCNELAALGARGVSLIFSSGDEGVGQDGTCVSNDGKVCIESTLTVSFQKNCVKKHIHIH
jgi:hypothetical protein